VATTISKVSPRVL